MPLPFILGAAAVFGAVKTIDSLDTMDRAKSINREAQEIADNAKSNYEAAKRDCQNTLECLGKNKVYIKQTSIKNFTHYFLQIHNLPFEYNVKINELREEAISDDKLMRNVEDFEFLDFAAIGVAGYALGALNPITIAFSGLILRDKADTALSNAKSNRDKARMYEEQCRSACSFLNAVSARGYQINEILDELNEKFIPTVKDVKDIISTYGTDFRQYSYNVQRRVMNAFSVSDVIRQILNTPMLTENGKNINPQIVGLIEKHG